MEFYITSSKIAWNEEWLSNKKTFETIQDIVDFMDESGHDVIISRTTKGELLLEIYDDYRE